jgi:hypothetical protein
LARPALLRWPYLLHFEAETGEVRGPPAALAGFHKEWVIRRI